MRALLTLQLLEMRERRLLLVADAVERRLPVSDLLRETEPSHEGAQRKQAETFCRPRATLDR